MLAPRHELRHWTIPYYDGYLTFFDRGDAVLELFGANPHGGDEARYEAFIELAHAQLDRYVDEYNCKMLGGHEFMDGRCVKCWARDLEETE